MTEIRRAIKDITVVDVIKFLGYLLTLIVMLAIWWATTNKRLSDIEKKMDSTVSYEVMMLYLQIKAKEVDLLEKNLESVSGMSKDNKASLELLQEDMAYIQGKYGILNRGGKKKY